MCAGDIDSDVDNLENIDREINHLDNQKHLCRELLLGCTKPMVSTASNGPGRQYLNSSTSIPLSWFVHFMLSALTTSSRVLWEATLLTFTWLSISSKSILSGQWMKDVFVVWYNWCKCYSEYFMFWKPFQFILDQYRFKKQAVFRWADIPLITDGALVHAWHRFQTLKYIPNTQPMQWET